MLGITTYKMRSRCVFREDWMQPTDPQRQEEEWPLWRQWLARAGHDTHAYCRFCGITFTLGVMGRSAVTKHAKSDRHQKNVASKRGCPMSPQPPSNYHHHHRFAPGNSIPGVSATPSSSSGVVATPAQPTDAMLKRIAMYRQMNGGGKMSMMDDGSRFGGGGGQLHRECERKIRELTEELRETKDKYIESLETNNQSLRQSQQLTMEVVNLRQENLQLASDVEMWKARCRAVENGDVEVNFDQNDNFQETKPATE